MLRIYWKLSKACWFFMSKRWNEGKGKTLEEVSNDIENILYDQIVNQKFITWLTDLRARSHIKIIR